MVPRRFLKRRTLVIAAITVALSIGIVFASVPYLPHSIAPHGSIRVPVSHSVSGGNQTYPGFFALSLPGISNSESFALGVTVTGGIASFCVLQELTYQNWVSSYSTVSNPGNTFPASACILREQTTQSVLSFLPTTSGTWDVAALNTSLQPITVLFSPA